MKPARSARCVPANTGNKSLMAIQVSSKPCLKRKSDKTHDVSQSKRTKTSYNLRDLSRVDYDENNHEAEKLNEKLRRLRKTIFKKNAVIRKSKKQLENLTNQLNNECQANKENTEALNNLKGAYNQINLLQDTLDNALFLSQRTERRLTLRLENYDEVYNDMHLNEARLNTELGQARDGLEKANEEINRMALDIQVKAATIHGYQCNRTYLQDQVRELEAASNDKSRIIGELQNSINNHLEEINGWKNDYEELQNDFDRLEKEWGEKINHIEELRDHLSLSQAQHKSIKEKYDELQEKHKELQDDYDLEQSCQRYLSPLSPSFLTKRCSCHPESDEDSDDNGTTNGRYKGLSKRKLNYELFNLRQRYKKLKSKSMVILKSAEELIEQEEDRSIDGMDSVKRLLDMDLDLTESDSNSASGESFDSSCDPSSPKNNTDSNEVIMIDDDDTTENRQQEVATNEQETWYKGYIQAVNQDEINVQLLEPYSSLRDKLLAANKEIEALKKYIDDNTPYKVTHLEEENQLLKSQVAQLTKGNLALQDHANNAYNDYVEANLEKGQLQAEFEKLHTENEQLKKDNKAWTRDIVELTDENDRLNVKLRFTNKELEEIKQRLEKAKDNERIANNRLEQGKKKCTAILHSHKIFLPGYQLYQFNEKATETEAELLNQQAPIQHHTEEDKDTKIRQLEEELIEAQNSIRRGKRFMARYYHQRGSPNVPIQYWKFDYVDKDIQTDQESSTSTETQTEIQQLIQHCQLLEEELQTKK